MNAYAETPTIVSPFPSQNRIWRVVRIIVVFAALLSTAEAEPPNGLNLEVGAKLYIIGKVFQTIKYGLLVEVKEIQFINKRTQMNESIEKHVSNGLLNPDWPASMDLILVNQYPNFEKLTDSDDVKCFVTYRIPFTYETKESTKTIKGFTYDSSKKQSATTGDKQLGGARPHSGFDVTPGTELYIIGSVYHIDKEGIFVEVKEIEYIDKITKQKRHLWREATGVLDSLKAAEWPDSLNVIYLIRYPGAETLTEGDGIKCVALYYSPYTYDNTAGNSITIKKFLYTKK